MNLIKKIYYLVSLAEIKIIHLIFIFLLLLISMFLETLSLSLFIPVIQITQNNNMSESLFVKIFENFFPSVNDNNSYLKISIAVLTSIYLFKSIFLIFCYWIQVKFLVFYRIQLTEKLFLKYISKNYENFIKIPTAAMFRNINFEIDKASGNLRDIMSLATEILIVLGILIFLIIINPTITFTIIFIIMLFSILFTSFFRNKILKWGQLRIKADYSKNKHMQESFYGFRDILLSGSKDYFFNKFNIAQKQSNVLNGYRQFIQYLPRIWLELILLFTVLSIIYLMISLNKSTEDIITTLSIFVLASFRILPSVTKIITTLQSLKYYIPSVNKVYEELIDYDETINKSIKINNNQKIEFNEKINLENVSFWYDTNESKKIINNLSLNIKKGDKIGIFGKSGEGKSTLIDLLSGFLFPKKGRITIDEKNILENTKDWVKNIGYVSQEVFLYDDTIKNNIIFGRNKNKLHNENFDELLNKSNISSFYDKEKLIGEFGNQLSGGQKQRIAIARSMLNNPSLLILDEITSNLDKINSDEIINNIFNIFSNDTIIMITHDASLLDHCDKIYELKNGKLISK